MTINTTPHSLGLHESDLYEVAVVVGFVRIKHSFALVFTAMMRLVVRGSFLDP